MEKLLERKVGDVTIVKMPSAVDSNNAGTVEETLLALVKAGVGKLVCDFTENTYVSSAGLRVFMETYNDIEEKNGKMAFFGLSEVVHEVFDITGFTEIFPIVTSENEALNTLK